MGKTNQSTGPVESLTTGGDEGQIPVATAFGGLLMGSGTDVDVQEFTTSGTWTKPDGAILVITHVVGAGAGGSSNQSNGGGGGGEGFILILSPAQLGSSESVSIGAGGGVESDGGETSIGTVVTASGGKGAQEFDPPGGNSGRNMSRGSDTANVPGESSPGGGGGGYGGGNNSNFSDGGNAQFGGGGGGGGGQEFEAGRADGGQSAFAGDGGVGSTSQFYGENGNAPGGGGGGGGGEGARGYCKIWTVTA